jgi:hypothetical protein
LYEKFNPDGGNYDRWRWNFFDNAVSSIRYLIRKFNDLGCAIPLEIKDAVEFVLNFEYGEGKSAGLYEKFYECVPVVWANPEFRRMIQYVDGFSEMVENVDFFLNNLDRCKIDEKVNFKDCLKVYTITTGVIEYVIPAFGKEFVLKEVGGRKSERRKWIYCSDSNLIFFLVAIGDYDMITVEDSTLNRIEDGLTEFGRFANHPDFLNARIVLLFTKTSKFEQKFDRVEFRNIFPDFRGSCSDQAKDFLKEKFLAKCPLRTCLVLFVHLFEEFDINRICNIIETNIKEIH